ncbi:MAG: hypothetical protein ACR2JH_02910 [Solirubrobacteraceae bacterium]
MVVVVVVEVVVGGEDVVVDEVVVAAQVTPGIWSPGVLTHDGSAPEAVGIAERPITTAAAPAAATGILSFLRLNTVV